MVRHTRKRRVHNKRTRKQRGGVGKLSGTGNFGSLFAKRGGPPITSNTPSSVAPRSNVTQSATNDPLAKYRKMIKMGQPEGAVIQKMLTNGIQIIIKYTQMKFNLV